MARKAPKPEGPELSALSLPATQEHWEAALHRDKDQEQEIRYIALADIFASPSNPRRHIDERMIAELAHSIFRFGVIQPVTVRPKKGMAGKFELVCGERRWTASRKAERLTIPAIVRDLTDDEVLDLQFTENLQRQDVHPMDEAVTFKAMIDTGRYTIADIAAKVLKGDAFVAQRLSLNNLIAELQTDFWDDKFLIGHAILFSRLPADDQKALYKDHKGNLGYDTLRETKDYIDRNIIRKLSAAPFKRDDATLVPAAGPCTTCLKRSGCNTSLFADYSDDDRCFDQGCFKKKLNAFVIRKAKDTIENNPGILLVEGGHYGEKLDPTIKKAAADQKVRIFDSNSDVRSWAGNGYVAVKALMVSGSDVGKVKTMYVPGGRGAKKGNATSRRTAAHVQDEIDAIRERQKRALELDREKIWEKTRGMIGEPSQLEELTFDSITTTQEELDAMATAILMEIPSGEYRDAAARVAGIRGEFFYLDVEQVKKIKTITIPQIWHLLRLLMLGTLKNSGHPDKSAGPFMLMPVLRLPFYLGEKYIAIETEQTAEAAKRIEQAEKRMNVLKAEKKALEGKSPKAIKKTSPKKGGAKAKPVVDEDQDPGDDE